MKNWMEICHYCSESNFNISTSSRFTHILYRSKLQACEYNIVDVNNLLEGNVSGLITVHVETETCNKNPNNLYFPAFQKYCVCLKGVG